jgi:hypothetical protein
MSPLIICVNICCSEKILKTTKNDKRKRNIFLNTQLIIQQDDPPLQTGVNSAVRQGQVIHNFNVIFMYYSNITVLIFAVQKKY